MQQQYRMVDFMHKDQNLKKQKIVSTFENTMIHKLICNILKIEIYNDEIIKNIIK